MSYDLIPHVYILWRGAQWTAEPASQSGYFLLRGISVFHGAAEEGTSRRTPHVRRAAGSLWKSRRIVLRTLRTLLFGCLYLFPETYISVKTSLEGVWTEKKNKLEWHLVERIPPTGQTVVVNYY